MATFGYGRVSTRDQDAQNQQLEIERAGYTVDYWFSDTMSGKVSATQRPQFRELLAKIRNGERLVVAKLDRLGRDAQDIGATIKLLAARRIEVIVLQLGKLDLASAPGKMVLAVLAAMAEMERDLLVERTQAGLARAKADGKALGRPTRTTALDRAKIMELHAAGMSLQKIADQFDIGKATVFDAIKASKAAAPAPAKTATAKTSKGTRKAAKKAAAPSAAATTDAEDQARLERRGQLRLSV